MALGPENARARHNQQALIERSSLGTESAQALINSVSPEHGRRIAKEAARREAVQRAKEVIALAKFMYTHGNPELSDEDREILGPWGSLDEVAQTIWINLAGAAYNHLADRMNSENAVHFHHHDIEAHAVSFNEGYAEAVRQFTNPVDGIRNFPRCGHHLDDARCTRREHEGDHESTQGDEVIVWPAGEPDPEPAEDGWGDVNPNDPQGRTYRVTAEEYFSVPAETAEEPALCRDPECGACNAAEHPTTAEPGVEQMTAKPFDIDAAVERASEAVRAAFVDMQRWGLLGPTSAAESWPTWQDVPDGIWFTRNGLGPIVANRKRGALVDCRRRDGSTIVMPIPESFAGNPSGPFVPVEVDL